VGTDFRIRLCSSEEYDPEKWKPVFGLDHAPVKERVCTPARTIATLPLLH
jgi:hypothetical protein